MLPKSCVYILLVRQRQNHQKEQQLTTMRSVRALCTFSLVPLLPWRLASRHTECRTAWYRMNGGASAGALIRPAFSQSTEFRVLSFLSHRVHYILVRHFDMEKNPQSTDFDKFFHFERR